MKNIVIILILFVKISTYSQKINTDSLLVATNKQFKLQNFSAAKKLAQKGISIAPDYLDFKISLGLVYANTSMPDSARIYFKKVLEKNTQYKEVYLYLINLEIQQNNIAEAKSTINKALNAYPENEEFELKKLQILLLENNDVETLPYLEELAIKYPNNKKIKQEFILLKTKASSNRIGITYNNTSFSRNGVGPWHLTSLQYIKERKKFSFIARLNYAERHNFGSTNSGLQYELESYFKNTQNSYSYGTIAYSNYDNVFPKLRLGYSYYYNFNKGWEADAGIRYMKTTNFTFYTAAFGIGKYVGSYWLNLKPYLQFFENKIYPSLTATGRYYFNTKYDYVTAFIGTGTNPDERITLGQFENRFAFKSYRFGAGFNKILNQQYIIGFQASFNKQEYKLNSFQNEYDLFVSLQYKF